MADERLARFGAVLQQLPPSPLADRLAETLSAGLQEFAH